MAFTLVELLITVSIIAIMASMVLFALYRAQETAKAHKTRALIAKLDQVIKDKWQAYQYRRVPVDLGPDRYMDSDMDGQWDPGEPFIYDWNNDGDYDPAPGPREAAKLRLDALHDLMRMELPDRYSDIVEVGVGTTINGPVNPAVATFPLPTPDVAVGAPALFRNYFRRIDAAANSVAPAPRPTIVNQGAEMLYLIVMTALAGDEDSRDVFKPDNIGDIDDDGMPEFIDGWRRPIRFIRWAPGIDSDLQVVARGQVTDANPSGSTTIVTVMGAGLSQANGAYVGGAMGILDQTPPAPNQALLPKPIIGNRMARITGYSFAAGIGTFTCVGGAPAPFNGNPPIPNDTVVIMAPDPFDVTDAQRAFANLYYTPTTYVPSFAIYPLIYSAGPDGQYGINGNIEGPMLPSYSYPDNGVKPFVEFTTVSNATDPPYLMFGASGQIGGERLNASLDNIHNHLQGLR